MKKIITLFLCSAIMSTTVFASDNVIIKQELPGKINVEVKVEGNENILFQVLPSDVNIDEASDNDIYNAVQYLRSIDANDEGEINFEFRLGKVGEYTL